MIDIIPGCREGTNFIHFFCRNREMLSGLKRSNTFPRNATPPLVSRRPEYHGSDYNDNTLNEDSLFSEIHRASTVSILTYGLFYNRGNGSLATIHVRTRTIHLRYLTNNPI